MIRYEHESVILGFGEDRRGEMQSASNDIESRVGRAGRIFVSDSRATDDSTYRKCSSNKKGDFVSSFFRKRGWVERSRLSGVWMRMCEGRYR